MMLTRILMILGLSLGFAVACDSDDDDTDAGDDHGDNDDGTGEASDCEVIASKCHDNPENDPEITECHDIGHDEDAAVCAENLEHCVELCEHGHGSDDHGETGTEDGDSGTGTEDGDSGTGTEDGDSGTGTEDGDSDSGQDGSDSGAEGACAQLSEHCHENPDNHPDIEECHEHGHNGDETVCEEHLDECLEICAG